MRRFDRLEPGQAVVPEREPSLRRNDVRSFRFSVVGPVHPYRGGIAHHTTMLSRTLAERHQVQVMSFRRQYPAGLYPGSTDRDPSRQALGVPVPPCYVLDPLHPWTWWAAAREIERFSPDAVVLQWWTTFWAPAFASLAVLLRRRQFRPVFLVHNALPHEPRFFDAWLGRLALARGHAFVAHSARERQRLLELVPGARVSVCGHPRYAMLADEMPTRAEARARLGLPLDGPVALFFGIVRPYKGLRHLIDALGILRQRGVRVHLVVAREFWEDRRQYERQIASLGVSDRVVLADRYVPNEDLSVFFAAADVLVAPYIGGTQSGAMKMAEGFGLPVIATHGAGLPAAGGRSVPPADPSALADAIAMTCQEPAVRPRERPAPDGKADGWDALAAALEASVAR